MKRLLPIILLALSLSACTLPVIRDTRPPTSTPTATATLEPTATIVPTATVTATVTITVTPVIEPTPCLIKATKASGLYHMPGTLTYKRTRVIPERGDKWECTEQQAQDDGFTKAKK